MTVWEHYDHCNTITIKSMKVVYANPFDPNGGIEPLIYLGRSANDSNPTDGGFEQIWSYASSGTDVRTGELLGPGSTPPARPMASPSYRTIAATRIWQSAKLPTLITACGTPTIPCSNIGQMARPPIRGASRRRALRVAFRSRRVVQAAAAADSRLQIAALSLKSRSCHGSMTNWPPPYSQQTLHP